MRIALLLALIAASLAAQNIYVDDSVAGPGTGTATDPYRSIADAVTQANASTGIPTIWIAPGTYPVGSTIAVQHSVILSGSTVLVKDTYGPTGAIQSSETRVVGTSLLGSTPLFTVGKSGQVIANVEIRGLVLEAQSNNGGLLELKRVQNALIHDNLLLGTTSLAAQAPGLSTYASSGLLQNLYMTGLLGGAFLSGGYPGSPGNLTVKNVRATANRNGIQLVGTSDGITEPGNQLTISLVNSEISNNTAPANAVSVGLRFLIKGNEALASTNLHTGSITASVVGNKITGNAIGIALDSGFTYRLVPPASNNVCDNRTFSGSITASFSGNTVTGNPTPSMVTFTRLQVELGLTPISQWQYLHNSNFIVSSGNEFAGVQIYKPLSDPYTGPCPHDATSEPLNNLLILNGLIR